MVIHMIWKKLGSTKSIIFLFLVFVCFFLVLSSYGGTRLHLQTTVCSFQECETKKSNDTIKESDNFQRIRTRLKTRHDTSPTESFLRTQAQTQRSRRQQIHDSCQKYYTPESNILEDPPYDIYVDDRHKIAYCSIPKIASTSWKRVWVVLTGLANTTDQYSQQVINNEMARTAMRHLSQYPPKIVQHILANYTKFMFARHPLSRVLSAFRNKLAPDSDFIMRDKWRNKLGSYITRKYRTDPKYKDVNYTIEHYDLTFTEFVRYLTDKTDDRALFNRHWMEMYAQCLPCEIQYDFVGKYETLAADAKYVLTKLNVSEVVEFPSFQGSSPTNSSTTDTLVSYYSEVPWKYIERLLIRYNLDIRLFGYGPYPMPKDEFLDWLKRTAEIHTVGDHKH